MNRRQFLATIGAAIAAPLVGANLAGAVSLPAIWHDCPVECLSMWDGVVIDGLWLWMHKEDE